MLLSLERIAILLIQILQKCKCQTNQSGMYILLSGSSLLWKYKAAVCRLIFPHEAADNNIAYSNKTLPHI